MKKYVCPFSYPLSDINKKFFGVLLLCLKKSYNLSKKANFGLSFSQRFFGMLRKISTGLFQTEYVSKTQNYSVQFQSVKYFCG